MEKYYQQKLNSYILIVVVNTSNEFQNLCSVFGITHQLTCSHMQKQNRVTELEHIIETTLTLLSKATIPSSFWYLVLCFSIETFITNKLPSNILHYSVEVGILQLITRCHVLFSGSHCHYSETNENIPSVMNRKLQRTLKSQSHLNTC